ncbi:hypothetical protein [uncultured Anaerococcus sp.]|uniref:hypothetical protein n=1 Tax=uncultured Anaerococcus sp. TaxID=293428 RepID=UPI00288A0FA7|nr:hypothetical protein [uncultured Anaerococcus sp.]
MKNRRNKVGFGILSLALALALPLNASATEQKSLDQIDTKNTEQPSKLIDDKEINTTVGQDRAATVQPITAPQTGTASQSSSASQTKDKDTENKNYRSQKGNEQDAAKDETKVTNKDEIEVNPSVVDFKAGMEEGKNCAYLTYTLGITGDHLEKEYTVSVFALKNSQVKNIKINQLIPDDKPLLSDQEKANVAETISGSDLFGFRIKTKFANTGVVQASVKITEGEDPGDYSLYYLVSCEGKSFLGKFDANVTKVLDSYALYNNQIKRDYEKTKEEKDNPLEKLPFTKYLLNDTNEEKKLLTYLNYDPSLGKDYKLVLTYINPNTLEKKNEEVTDPEKQIIPANSLVRFDLREKSDEKNPIEDGKIEVGKFETTDFQKFVASKDAEKDQSEQGKEQKKPSTIGEENQSAKDLVEAEKDTLRKLYPNLDPENLDIKGFSQAIKKQSEKLEGLIDKTNLAKAKDIEEEGPSQDRAAALKLVEEQKKSILQLEPNIDEENLDIRGLAQALTVQTQRIQELIQQAFLDYELDSLAELEKENPEKAKEEYKKIAELVKEAEDISKKANNKLIELDEINLIDNTTDPLITSPKGAKPVLNLGMLTPLTKINDLTKDSPKESERSFSTDLQNKLDAAIKKVDTVTITEKDDKKAKDQAKDKDPNKNIIVVDSKNKDRKEINTPIFVRYLQRLKNSNK